MVKLVILDVCCVLFYKQSFYGYTCPGLSIFIDINISLHLLSIIYFNYYQAQFIQILLYQAQNMTSKKDWNDLSDSQNDSDPEPQTLQQNYFTQNIPSLSKILSSPVPVVNKKSSSNQQQNLLKLQNFQGQQIWLFIPLYYRENVDEVDKILRSYDFTIQCRKFDKGWNILLKRQFAEELILNGKRQDKFNIKFFFSSKNYDAPPLYSKKSTPNRTNGEKKRYMLKSPTSKYQTYKQGGKYQQKRQGEKKIYQQKKIEAPKEQKQQKKNQPNQQKTSNLNHQKQKNFQLKKTESQGSGNSQNVKKGYKAKYKQKQTGQTGQNKQENQIQSTKKKNYAPKQNLEPAKIESQLKKDAIEVKQQEQNQKQQEKAVQKSPKKKKKSNKKKQLANDPNNPFSMLQSY